ncbi:MAG: toxin-activating lysine-acyltransferase [Rhodospirillales bacterium]|nr:toxin-activating lysine-acyltransferase [Rhodospirillales bacterium]
MYKVARASGPTEWRSGDRLRIVDVVAPFGGGKDIREDAQKFAERLGHRTPPKTTGAAG